MDYPIITSYKYKNETYIKQERFFSSRISQKGNKENSLWNIPIYYKTGEETLKVLMTKKSIPLIGKNIGKINKDENSFIRVRYDKETLSYLKKEIEDGHISTRDRLGIIRDLFALAEGGYIKTEEALEFSLCYKDENEFIVWSEIASGINKIYNLIDGEKVVEKYRKYALSLFSPLAKKVGFLKKQNEKHSDVLLRNLALNQSAFYGDAKTIKIAKKIWKDRLVKNIDKDIKGVIYNIVAYDGKVSEWKIFENMYKKETMAEEKERIGRAMGSFKDKNLLLKTLLFSISKNVRNQDAPFIISAVWANKQSRNLTWKFIKNNWKLIFKKFADGGNFLSRVLSSLGNHTNTKDLNDIKKFFKTHAARGSEKTLEQAYERIASNAAWIKDDKKDIKNWLKKNF